MKEIVAKERHKKVYGTEYHGNLCKSLRALRRTCLFNVCEINTMLASLVAVLCLAMLLTGHSPMRLLPNFSISRSVSSLT